jgi:hypothetical protein
MIADSEFGFPQPLKLATAYANSDATRRKENGRCIMDTVTFVSAPQARAQ